MLTLGKYRILNCAGKSSCPRNPEHKAQRVLVCAKLKLRTVQDKGGDEEALQQGLEGVEAAKQALIAAKLGASRQNATLTFRRSHAAVPGALGLVDVRMVLGSMLAGAPPAASPPRRRRQGSVRR